MALRKLEINDGRLMLDDAFAGLVTTVPSDVMSAEAAASTEDGAVTLKVRWTIEKKKMLNGNQKPPPPLFRDIVTKTDKLLYSFFPTRFKPDS